MQKLMQKHRKFMKGDAGFSLVELIIVIAIMAALVAILAPQYLKYVEKSRVTGDENTIAELESAIKVAAVDENHTIKAGDKVVINSTGTTATGATGSDIGTALTEYYGANYTSAKTKSKAYNSVEISVTAAANGGITVSHVATPST